jgi:eukaryotic-like serine/threonine-protein kinase
MNTEAISEFQKARALSASRPLDSGSLAHAYALVGRTDEALQILDEAKKRDKYFPAYDIALIYVGLGQKDSAFEWLDKAVEERSPWLIHLTVDPRFDPIRLDPRFKNLIQRIGLV